MAHLPTDITVVIPALDAAPYLPKLLRMVERQTVHPREIVIVDSSPGDETASLIASWRGPLPIVYQRVDFAFPGHARNIGVALAKGEWVAFLDCRTLPRQTWLEDCLAVAWREGADFIAALLECSADTSFKRCLLAASYGNGVVRSLPGSLVRRRTFQATSGFRADVRAGEDIEWMSRLVVLGARTATVRSPLLIYEGLPATLSAAVRKWHRNNVSAARIEVCTSQKMGYVTLLVAALFLLAFKWNHLFAHWREDSVYYIPNITKIFVASVFAIYLAYRGLIRPVRSSVPLSFLVPWRWMAVCLVGLCLDLAKAPGMILGAWVLIRKRVGAVMFCRLC